MAVRAGSETLEVDTGPERPSSSDHLHAPFIARTGLAGEDLCDQGPVCISRLNRVLWPDPSFKNGVHLSYQSTPPGACYQIFRQPAASHIRTFMLFRRSGNIHSSWSVSRDPI